MIKVGAVGVANMKNDLLIENYYELFFKNKESF